MIRRAFTMRLKPEALAEYKHHHDNIWPELVAEIERAGIASITTFQRDLDLFLVSEISDEAAWDRLWNSETHRRWAEVMQPLMHLRDDGIVDAGALTEIFHLQTGANVESNGRSAAAMAAMFEPAIIETSQLDALAPAAVETVVIVEAAPVEEMEQSAPMAALKASPRRAQRRARKPPARGKSSAKPRQTKPARKPKPPVATKSKRAVKKAAKKKAPPKKPARGAKKKTPAKKRR